MQFKPTKAEMDRTITGMGSECERFMLRWKMFAEKMDTITDSELTALGYTTDQVNYIRSFTVALKNIELKYRNQTPLNADDPSYFVKQMSTLVVV